MGILSRAIPIISFFNPGSGESFSVRWGMSLCDFEWLKKERLLIKFRDLYTTFHLACGICMCSVLPVQKTKIYYLSWIILKKQESCLCVWSRRVEKWLRVFLMYFPLGIASLRTRSSWICGKRRPNFWERCMQRQDIIFIWHGEKVWRYERKRTMSYFGCCIGRQLSGMSFVAIQKRTIKKCWRAVLPVS